MKIALINENSQKKKNAFIYDVLKRVCDKYHHEVFNYGVEEGKKADIDYVGAGVLASILLSAKAVDFVIMGCASGQGASISANMMPNVYCGYITDQVDARLFMRVNAGNAVSIPFGKYFGIGSEFLLESIFEALFKEEYAGGFPSERKEIQDNQRNMLKKIKRSATRDLDRVLEEMDKDFLRNMIHNDYFEENFFMYTEDNNIREILKNIIDAFE